MIDSVGIYKAANSVVRECGTRNPFQIAHDLGIKIFYSDDGSTSVEVALKLAYHHALLKGKKRPLFIALEGGYHGDTVGAMSVGTHFNAHYSPLLFEIERVPVPRPVRGAG